MVDKKNNELSPAEKKFLEKKTLKEASEAEIRKTDIDFWQAVAKGNLSEFEGMTPQELENQFKGNTIGKYWVARKKFLESKENAENLRKQDIERARNAILKRQEANGPLTSTAVRNILGVKFHNILENYKKPEFQRSIDILFDARINMPVYTDSRILQGWKFNTGSSKAGNDIPITIGKIILAGSTPGEPDKLKKLRILSRFGDHKGIVDVSELIKDFKPKPNLIKELVEIQVVSNLATNLLASSLQEINAYADHPEILTKQLIIDNLTAFRDRVHIEKNMLQTNKDFMVDLIDHSLDYMTGYEGELSIKGLLERQHRHISDLFSSSVRRHYPELHNIADGSRRNLATNMLLEMMGYPTLEPVLNADNSINKRYHGKEYTKVTGSDVWRSDEIEMQIQQLNDEIENAKNSNRYLNARGKVAEITTGSYKGTLSNEEAQKVLNHFEIKYQAASTSINKSKALQKKALVEFLASTGLRESEAVNVKIKDLELDKNRVFVYQGKGGKSAYAALLPLEGVTEDSKMWIQKYLDEAHLDPTNKDAYLFHKPNKVKEPLSVSWVSTTTKSAAEETGISPSRLGPHQFRHFYATEGVRQGVPVSAIQQGLRHTNLQTTSVYVHSIDPNLVDKDGFVQLSEDGLILGADAGEGNQLQILENAKKKLQEEQKSLITNQNDYKINKEQIRVLRKGAEIFPVSVFPNLNMNIKSVEIDTTYIPQTTMQNVNEALTDPYKAIYKPKKSTIAKGITVNPMTVDRDAVDLLVDISFHNLENHTDDIVVHLADPDNIAFSGQASKYSDAVDASTTVFLGTKYINGPYTTSANIQPHTPFSAVDDIEVIEAEVTDVVPTDNDGKKKPRKNIKVKTSKFFKNNIDSKYTSPITLVIGAKLLEETAIGTPFINYQAIREGVIQAIDAGTNLLPAAAGVKSLKYLTKGLSELLQFGLEQAAFADFSGMGKDIYGNNIDKGIELPTGEKIYLNVSDVDRQIKNLSNEGKVYATQLNLQELGYDTDAPTGFIPKHREEILGEWKRQLQALGAGTIQRDLTSIMGEQAPDIYGTTVQAGIQEELGKDPTALRASVTQRDLESYIPDKEATLTRRQDAFAQILADYPGAKGDPKKQIRDPELEGINKARLDIADRDLEKTQGIIEEMNNLNLNFTNQPEGEDNAVNG